VISFAFTVDQIRSAPPEIRKWFETEIINALRDAASPRPETVHSSELAVCSPDEALAVFEFFRNDFATAQVFLEFGREPPLPNSPRPLHAFAIGEFKRKLRLSDDRLADCFAVINRRFIRLRSEPDAVLLGFDQAGHVYIHEVTHSSIRGLWEKLTEMESDTEPVSARAALPFGFVPPQVGPSEAVVAHQRAPA
jgi:hypothetical protein